jgi:hypothetical protein
VGSAAYTSLLAQATSFGAQPFISVVAEDDVSNSGSSIAIANITSTGNSAQMGFISARGTYNAPAFSQAGDQLMSLFVTTWDGTTYGSFSAGYVAPLSVFAAENFSSSSFGTYVQMQITPLGGTLPLVAMQLRDFGGGIAQQMLNAGISDSVAYPNWTISSDNSFTSGIGGGFSMTGAPTGSTPAYSYGPFPAMVSSTQSSGIQFVANSGSYNLGSGTPYEALISMSHPMVGIDFNQQQLGRMGLNCLGQFQFNVYSGGSWGIPLVIGKTDIEPEVSTTYYGPIVPTASPVNGWSLGSEEVAGSNYGISITSQAGVTSGINTSSYYLPIKINGTVYKLLLA